jgi:predicted metal-dependent peptidase
MSDPTVVTDKEVKESSQEVRDKAKDLITNAILYLYKYEPFYAYLVAQMRFRISDEIHTLGVGYFNGTIQFVYNPQFVVDHEDLVIELIKHECGHILHNHLSVQVPKDPVKKQVMNVAMDSYINIHLPKILSRSSLAENIIKGKPDPLKPYVGRTGLIYNGTYEELYVELMKLVPEEMKQAGKFIEQIANAIANGTIDDHSDFGKGISQEEADFINKAIVEEAYSKAKGDVPAEYKREIEAIMSKHTHVDWRKELRRFSGHAVESGKHVTITKPNKKYGYPFFGKHTDYAGNIALAIDVSGSVNDEDLKKFIGEAYTISKQTGLRLLIVQGDTEVADVSRYSRKLKKFTRMAGGGTYLQPMIDAASKKSNFVVVFTDGYADIPKPTTKHTKLMFVLTKDHSKEFEEKVKEIGKVAVMID